MGLGVKWGKLDGGEVGVIGGGCTHVGASNGVFRMGV